MKQRIAKYISDTGLYSRRVAEQLILSGKVAVNGIPINTPVFFVDDLTDVVCIDGKVIKKITNTDKKIYMFNKPINTMTTSKDPKNRKTIYDILDKKYSHLKYIGRLDFKTTGLLLLTNSGDIVRKLSLPINHIPRTYIATVIDHSVEQINIARQGVVIDNIHYRPMKIDVLDKHNLRITIEEGKKNEIRIVLKHIGISLTALHRISYGTIQLGNLPVGKIVEVDKKTIDLMLKNL